MIKPGWTGRRIGTASLAIVLTATIASFVGNPKGWGPRASDGVGKKATARSGVIYRSQPARRGDSPFDCRVASLGEGEMKAILEGRRVFAEHPGLLTPHILQNPLLSDLVSVTIENASKEKVQIYGHEEHPFWIVVEIRDAANKRVSFPHGASSGLKRMTPAPGHTSTLELEPGRVVTQRLGIWAGIRAEDPPVPGRYTIRVICSYFRSPDGQDCRIESGPMEITVTEDHIREWSRVVSMLPVLPEIKISPPAGGTLDLPLL